MQNSEVPCVRYLIGRIVKTYDYINRVVITLPLSVYEGTWTTLSPLVAMHHHDLACAQEIFRNYYVPQQWHPSQVLCIDVICTSRTQVSCGRYKSYCLPACHTLVRRYCWMKRPGPTLRVRLRETGFAVASTRCLKVTGGCLSLSL